MEIDDFIYLSKLNVGSYTANSIVSSIKDNYPQFIIIDSILEGKRQKAYMFYRVLLEQRIAWILACKDK